LTATLEPDPCEKVAKKIMDSVTGSDPDVIITVLAEVLATFIALNPKMAHESSEHCAAMLAARLNEHRAGAIVDGLVLKPPTKPQ
jgi:hypothetical protein